MGAVYRATDTKLNRDVAIKVLPDTFASDPDRLARFTREAQVLASLNHPNIAAIYGVEDRALVLELVEGSEPKGPLTAEEALPIVHQLADALEYAHERGIVHRDLKPANLKLTPEGNLKVLDFGLAKALSTDSAATSTSTANSPTLTMRATMAGMIMGTAAYMAPEQARGQLVDRRADIWAYGVILFKLLSGQHPYDIGGTVTDTLAAIVLKDPDFSLLPKDTPPQLRRLIARCLRKDQKTRLRDIGEARVLLDEPTEEAPASPARRSWLPGAVSAAAIAAAGTAWMRPGSTPSGARMQFSIPLPGGTLPRSAAATEWVPSPDGRNLAIVAPDGPTTRLWVRPLGSGAAHPLDKTEDANFPFWSPDGQWIAFFSEGKIKRVAVSGGAVQKICDAPPNSTSQMIGDGGAWNQDDVIVFASGGKPLMKVAATGGVPVAITTLAKDEILHSWPQFLPDGKHFLYLAKGNDQEQDAIYVQELGSATRVRLLKNVNRVQWSTPGYVLFTKEGTLYAQRMNPSSFQLEGEAIVVAEEVQANEANGRSTFAVSRNGLLIFRNGARRERQVNWRSLDGKIVQAIGRPGPFGIATLSPDDKSLAITVTNTATGQDLWVMDLTNGVITPMTRDGRISYVTAVWSRDSKQLALATKEGLVQVTAASGQSRVLTKEVLFPQDYSPDGHEILCRDPASTKVFLVSLTEGSPVRQVITTPYRVGRFAYSPDGKYVAYQSYEGGSPEIFVAAFPGFSVKRRVTQNGGSIAHWASKNRLLFAVNDGSLNEVEVRTGADIEIGNARALF
jgi:serine/threonine protein kinase